MFDDVGALGIGAGDAALASGKALGEGATGPIGAGIEHGTGSLSSREVLAGETALDEGVTGDSGAEIGIGVGSPSGIGALAGEASIGKGESIVLFLGSAGPSSLSLFFP